MEKKSLKLSTRRKKEKEKEIIIVYLSILLIHELCHLIIRWKGNLDSPTNLAEAGEYMEYVIFKGRIRLLIHSKSKWDENKCITGNLFAFFFNVNFVNNFCFFNRYSS